MSIIMPLTAILVFFGFSAATCVQGLKDTNTSCTSEGFMQTPPDETSLLQLGSHYAQGEQRGVSAGHAAPSPSKPVAAEEVDATLKAALVAEATRLFQELAGMKVEVKTLGNGPIGPHLESTQLQQPQGDQGVVSDSEVVNVNSKLIPIDKGKEWLDEHWAPMIRRGQQVLSSTLVIDPGNDRREILSLDTESKDSYYTTTTSGTYVKLSPTGGSDHTEKVHEAGAEVMPLVAPYGTLRRGFRHSGPDKMFCLELASYFGGYDFNPYILEGKWIRWQAGPGQENTYATQVDHVADAKHGSKLLFLKDNVVEGPDFYKDYTESEVKPLVMTFENYRVRVEVKPHGEN